MSPFVSPQLHLFPWCAVSGDPAGRPGRRPRLPLGGGPRSKFCLLLAHGTLSPPPGPLGVVPGRVPSRAAPSLRRPPFGFLAAPRPALLQPSLPRGRSVLISWGPTQQLSCPPPRLRPSLGPPPPPGLGRRWEVEVEAGAGSLPPQPPTLGGAMKTHSQTFVVAPSVFSRCGRRTRCLPLFSPSKTDTVQAFCKLPVCKEFYGCQTLTLLQYPTRFCKVLEAHGAFTFLNIQKHTFFFCGVPAVVV